MNTDDFFSNLRTEIRSLNWPTTANRVFRCESVYVVSDVPIERINSFKKPCCFITDEGAKQYPQNAELMEQAFSVTVFVENYNDSFGEAVMIGANEVSDQSTGQGILAIEQIIINHLRSLTSLSSQKMSLTVKGKVKTRDAKGNRTSVFRRLQFSALLSFDDSVTDESEIQRAPGFLYLNPVSVSGGDYGTKLGYTKTGVIVDPGYNFIPLSGETSGSTPELMHYTGNNVQLVTEFLQYNSNTMSTLFTGMSSGTSVSIPGTVKTGADYNVAGKRNTVVFVPDDVVNNNVVILFRAVSRINNFARFARGEDTSFRCLFQGFKDDSSRILYMGPASSAPI